MNLNRRDWSLPPAISSTSSALAPGTYTRHNSTVAPKHARVTLWSRLRVGMSQMFRRVAVFFRRRVKKPRTSSMGSSSSGRYWDSMEDEISFVEVISPLDSAVVGTESPPRTPFRPQASRPVDIRMDAEQERQNRFRQQFRNESSRSRRGAFYTDDDDD